jgi:hypothetical protein
MLGEGVPADKLGPEGGLGYENLIKLVIDNADGIVVEAEQLPAEVENYLAASGKKVLRPEGEPGSNERLEQYKAFYDSIL